MLKDVVLFKNVEDAVIVLKPIAEALNFIQSNKCTIADAVDSWKKLVKKFRDKCVEGKEWLERAEKRYNSSVPDSWFAAHLLCPQYAFEDLSASELKKADEWIKSNYPECRPSLIDFIAEKKAFQEQFEESGKPKKRVNFLKYQLSIGNLSEQLCNLACRLESLAPSSAGLERMFSTMGFIQIDLRNRLGMEKLEKLTLIKKTLID